MEFEQFAAAHGLMIRTVEYGRWCRVPTEDHPHSQNGAYKHLGEVAFLQNHATMPEPATWFPESQNEIRIDAEAIKRRQAQANKELAENRARAAKKAGWILHQAKYEKHAYLDSKGFGEDTGLVWTEGENNLLVIPMRIGTRLVGCQTINRDGDKKFLFGQITSGAEFLIDNKGSDWFCEGYCTGLSLRAVLHALKVRYRIHITFSAHNLSHMARACTDAFVIADNDLSKTGERAAIESGKPWFMSPTVGQDFNDWHREIGVFRLSQELRKFITENRL